MLLNACLFRVCSRKFVDNCSGRRRGECRRTCIRSNPNAHSLEHRTYVLSVSGALYRMSRTSSSSVAKCVYNDRQYHPERVLEPVSALLVLAHCLCCVRSVQRPLHSRIIPSEICSFSSHAGPTRVIKIMLVAISTEEPHQ